MKTQCYDCKYTYQPYLLESIIFWRCKRLNIGHNEIKPNCKYYKKSWFGKIIDFFKSKKLAIIIKEDNQYILDYNQALKELEGE